MSKRITEERLREVEGRSLNAEVVNSLVDELRRLRGLIVKAWGLQSCGPIEAEGRAIRKEEP
jgi:hypothetical protein